MTQLSIVPAGAGAGKTYHIQKTLADWVQDGSVAPGRILAVTFTEAAASELRGRVQAELMKRDRISDALEIDHAYVGTIHALGQRLLTEHAFAAGRSPGNRLLSEPERDLLIRMELAKCVGLRPLMENLTRFGYRWNFLTGASAEDAFRSDVLRTVDLIRGLGDRGSEPGILAPAVASLKKGYGPCAPDGAALSAALRRTVVTLLDMFPESLGTILECNATAKKAFISDHQNLRKAAQDETLETDWALWQKLRGLRKSMRGSPTPEGYDELAEAVTVSADELLRHPGPLADACAKVNALVIGAQEVLEAYQAAKRKAGLIDYADMIVETETLLRTQPDILSAVLGEIDCVVIDEFQDTNPVQFALLWQLAQGAKRALIVGDTKQSIMGFQGADARLSQALQDSHASAVTPLDRNWRSDPRIMGFVNALGPVLFPQGYNALTPVREETGEPALEVINLPGGRSDTTAGCVADRIARMLADNTQVFDKVTEVMRPAKASDIAVLCYTGSKCETVAAAIEAHGLPVRLQQSGWLGSLAMRVARAALAYIADPSDRLAALTWLTLGPPRMPIEDALRNAVDRVLDTHTALKPLAALHEAEQLRPVVDTVAEMLRSTNLREWAASIDGPAQALADLARLEAEAQTFDSLATDLRSAAGFHGYGMQIFLGWIIAQTDKAWDKHPDPDGWSSSGIEISTWHSAKGREWPITIVAGLDQTFAERPGTLSAEFDGFEDLGNVLSHANLGYLPKFDAPETQAVFAEAHQEQDEQEAARELYVALTRARDRLILALPREKTKARDRAERMVDLLRDRGGLQTDAGFLEVCGEKFAANVTDGASDVPEVELTSPSLGYPRFGTSRQILDAPHTPWRQSPSTQEPPASQAPTVIDTVELGAAIDASGAVFASAADRGTILHLAFRVLTNQPNLSEQLIAATGLAPKVIDEIATQAEILRNRLAVEGYDQLHFELPVQEIRPDGSQTNAIIDCLAEGPDGFLILDHKSGPCPDPEARFHAYLPQLKSYAQLMALTRPDKPVRSLAINWIDEGRLSFCSVDTMEFI